MITVKILLSILAILTSVSCAVLLVRGFGRTRARLLLWSAICFVGLTINNVGLFFDLLTGPDLDLRVARQIPALVGMLFLLFGFIWDAD